jgi:hypothetical protein
VNDIKLSVGLNENLGQMILNLSMGLYENLGQMILD